MFLSATYITSHKDLPLSSTPLVHTNFDATVKSYAHQMFNVHRKWLCGECVGDYESCHHKSPDMGYMYSLFMC